MSTTRDTTTRPASNRANRRSAPCSRTEDPLLQRLDLDQLQTGGQASQRRVDARAVVVARAEIGHARAAGEVSDARVLDLREDGASLEAQPRQRVAHLARAGPRRPGRPTPNASTRPCVPVSCRTMPRSKAARTRARRTSGCSKRAKLRLRETRPGTSVIPTTSASRSTAGRITNRPRRARAPEATGEPETTPAACRSSAWWFVRKRGHELVEIALDDPIELVQREPDAVIGHAVLREVVRADLLASARRSPTMLRRSADSAASCFSRSRSSRRLRRTFIAFALFLSCERSSWHFTMMPARLVQDLHGAVGRVDALPARTAARGDGDLEVLVVDLDVDVVGLGEHGDGRRRRVDAPLRLGGGHALHAVHAALEAELRVHVLAGDERDDLLVAAGRRSRSARAPRSSSPCARRSARTCGRDRPRRAPPPRRPRRCGSRGSCSSCRSGSGGRSRSWIDASRRDRSACKLGELGLRELAELRIGEGLLVLADLPLDVAVARHRADERLEVAPLLVELLDSLLRSARTSGLAEQLVELAVAARELLELLDREHQAARAGTVAARRRGRRRGARRRSGTTTSLVRRVDLALRPRGRASRAGSPSATSSWASSGSMVVIFCTRKPGQRSARSGPVVQYRAKTRWISKVTAAMTGRNGSFSRKKRTLSSERAAGVDARERRADGREDEDRDERHHDEERRAAARVQRRLRARVLDDEGLAGLVGADRLVLGAVVLKDAPDLGDAPDGEQVADDDGELERAGDRLERRALHLEAEVTGAG